MIWGGFQAILAALGALPRQSLVDILRQMVEQLQKLVAFFGTEKITKGVLDCKGYIMCLCLILQFLKISIVCFHPLIFCCQLQETGGTTPRGGCNSLRRGREHLPGEDFWLPRYVFGTSLPRQPNGMQVMLSMCGLAWFH